MSRIKKELYNRGYVGSQQKILNFKPRHPMLQAMDGWYKTPESPMIKMWHDSGSKLKFSRWLSKNGIDPNSELGQKLIKNNKSVSFKFSTRYKDILRCSTMHSKEYFISCLSATGMYCDAPVKYLTKEFGSYLGILYIPDAAGHIASRCFIAWTPYGLLPFRFYGDGPMQTCVEHFLLEYYKKFYGWKEESVPNLSLRSMLTFVDGAARSEQVYIDPRTDFIGYAGYYEEPKDQLPPQILFV